MGIRPLHAIRTDNRFRFDDNRLFPIPRALRRHRRVLRRGQGLGGRRQGCALERAREGLWRVCGAHPPSVWRCNRSFAHVARLADGRDGLDRLLKRRHVLMVVVAGHSGRFMPDDGLYYVQGNAGVGRHRDEGVAERVERRLGDFVRTPLDRHGHDYARVLENLVYAVMYLAHPVLAGCRPRTYCRKHISRPSLHGRLHQQVRQHLVDRNRDWTPLAVLLRLLGDLLYDRTDDVHLRPRQLAAVAESHPRVHRYSKEGTPFGTFAGSHVHQPRQLLDGELSAGMRIVRPQGESLPRISLGRRPLHYVPMNLPEDAQPIVVCRCRMVAAEVVEVLLGVVAGEVSHLRHLREDLFHVIQKDTADLLLASEGGWGEVSAHRGRLVCRPCIFHLELRTLGLALGGELALGHDRRLNVLEGAGGIVLHVWGKEPSGELLGLGAVAGSRGLAYPLAVDDASKRPDAGLLQLQPAQPLGATATGFLAAG